MNKIRDARSGFIFEDDELVMKFWQAKDGWVFLFSDGTKLCVDNQYYDSDLDEWVDMDALKAWYAVATSMQGTGLTRAMHARVVRGVKTFYPFHIEMECSKHPNTIGF